MALIPCTACGNRISSAAEACPRCGHPNQGGERVSRADPDPEKQGFRSGPGRRDRGLFIFAGVALLVVIVGVMAVGSGEDGLADGGESMDGSDPASAEQARASAPPPPVDPCPLASTQRLVDSLAPVWVGESWNVGDRVNASVRGCRFYPDEEIALLDVTVSWTGPLTREYYEMAGELELWPDRYSWKPVRTNAALQRFERERNEAVVVTGVLLGAAALIGEALAEDKRESERPATRAFGRSWLCVENGSEQTVVASYRWYAQTDSQTVHFEPGARWRFQTTFVRDTLRMTVGRGAYALPARYFPDDTDHERCPATAPTYRIVPSGDSLIMTVR